MEFKSGRGGKRNGSGRPKTGKKTAIFRCHVDLIDLFTQINKDYKTTGVMPTLLAKSELDKIYNIKSKTATHKRTLRLEQIDVLLREGYTRAIIADKLGVSVSTVDRVVGKLNKSD